jgi:thiol-disulfide isomerase/thioredoxin
MRALLLLLLTATLSAAGLKVGDPAPATRPESMLQGEAVKEFKKGEIYVFECWASWCGPCVASIPHLNELHQKLAKKGIVITGVNVWEAERDAASAQRAKDFLKGQGEKMSYRVAIGGKAFIKDWLEAAGVNGIPHAFVVSEGKIAWAGHPAELTAELLGDILTGTPLAGNPLAVETPLRGKKAAPTPKAALPDSEIEKAQAKLDALAKAMARKDWEAAKKALPEAAGVLPPEERKDLIDTVEAQIAFANGDPTKAFAQIEKAGMEDFDDAETMNELAWELVTNEAYTKFLNLPLAEKFAVQAVKLTKETHPDKLDTLARIRWLQGRKVESLELQGKAVGAAAADPRMQKLLQKTLDAMRKGELPKATTPEEDDK